MVGTRNFATTYFEDKDEKISGLEYDLATGFAQSQNRRIRFRVFDGIPELLEALDKGLIDFAAAGLTRTPDRSSRFWAGPKYQTVSQILFCRKDIRIKSKADLSKLRLQLVAGSSHVDTLGELKRDNPEVTWSEVESLTQVFETLQNDNADCTVADSNALKLFQRYFPQLKTRFSLRKDDFLVWYFAKNQERLRDLSTTWFEKLKESGRLRHYLDRYYGFLGDHDTYDTTMFLKRLKSRLPRYKKLFQRYGKKYDFPWKFLAAVSYQESHWDPQAISPTGVKGIMMLTKPTAEAMGVKDRTDPRESIEGGAKYLAKLRKRIPPFIKEPDRTFMMLASYNVGFGHLTGARQIAVRTHRNPNQWSSVKECLPLLTQKKYYQHLPNGYARGYEPLIYVQNVRNYYDLLKKREKL